MSAPECAATRPLSPPGRHNGAVSLRWPGLSVAALSGLLAGAGLLHFVAPEPYEAIVPRRLPAPRAIVYASGAAELACAAGLLSPRTRRAAGLATAGLFVVVFPANVSMAFDARRRSARLRRWVTYGRLPLQAPLVWWALRVAGRAPAPALVSMAATRRRGATGSASDL